MPVFVKPSPRPAAETRLPSGLFLSVIVLIAGCTRGVNDPHFEMSQVDTNWSSGQLEVTVQQQLTLSGEAKRALDHGIPLTLQLELVIRKTGGQAPLKMNVTNYEIRYLPLSKHYQLTQSTGVEIRTFPRLRHLLTALSSVTQSFNSGDLPEGRYELMARTHLDRQNMPPPMRLPMLFSAQWHHDSDWTTWLVRNENGS